jgi:transcriptional regulator with XRE-family HTH domain
MPSSDISQGPKRTENKHSGSDNRVPLGKRIRRRRRETGLSITQLGERTGLTASFISQVETGKTGLSINTLRILSEALDVPIFHFLLDEHEAIGAVVRKNERPVLELPNSEIRYEFLMPHLNLNLEVFIGYLDPGGQSSDSAQSHPSDECMLILQGDMEITLGETSYVLHAGDSISYDGRIPHRAVNTGNEQLVFVSAVTPPNF